MQLIKLLIKVKEQVISYIALTLEYIQKTILFILKKLNINLDVK